LKDILELSRIIVPVGKEDHIERGTIVRRIGNGKDQQGCFMEYDDENDMILVNVLDINGKSFDAPAGILVLRDGDTLFRYTTHFGETAPSKAAEIIITDWPLYKKNQSLQKPIIYFIKHSYTPELILYLQKKNILDYLFVPIQQKFKIGRFIETINWAKVRKEKFKSILDSLHSGSHLTYVAMIPQTKSYTPMFYSIGTKPHQETEMCLRSEPFNFVPTHGGHIKAVKQPNGMITYLVDAGSNFLGKGVKTSLSTAKEVADAMSKVYRSCKFIPLEGRNAFGEDQSY